MPYRRRSPTPPPGHSIRLQNVQRSSSPDNKQVPRPESGRRHIRRSSSRTRNGAGSRHPLLLLVLLSVGFGVSCLLFVILTKWKGGADDASMIVERIPGRTAVCFSGQVRTFGRNLPSIEHHFLERLPNDYDIHLVFNDNEEKKKGLGALHEHADILPSGVEVYHIIRDDPFRDEEDRLTFGALGLLTDYTTYNNRVPTKDTADGYVRKLAGFDSCLKLRRREEESGGFRYTHAARLRYDTLFQSDLPSAVGKVLHDGGAEGGSDGGFIVVPEMQSWDGYNDKMAWGTAGAMSVYQSQLQFVRELGLYPETRWCGALDVDKELGVGEVRQRKVLQPEACLKTYLENRTVKVVPVNVQLRILRPDGTLWEDLWEE